MKNTFLDKLLNRIDRVGQEDLQAYLQRLNSEKGFFETIFNTLQEGIVVVDSQGKIRYLNHAVTTLLGIDPAKALGTSMAQHLKELDWPKILAEGRVVNRDLEGLLPPAALPQLLSRPARGQRHLAARLRADFPRPHRPARAGARGARVGKSSTR